MHDELLNDDSFWVGRILISHTHPPFSTFYARNVIPSCSIIRTICCSPPFCMASIVFSCLVAFPSRWQRWSICVVRAQTCSKSFQTTSTILVAVDFSTFSASSSCVVVSSFFSASLAFSLSIFLSVCKETWNRFEWIRIISQSEAKYSIQLLHISLKLI